MIRNLMMMLSLALAACSTSEAMAPPPAAAPASSASSSAADKCGGRCPAGRSCVSYRGVGGNELFTCGVACGKDGKCPDGKKCQSIPDGPTTCN